MHITILGTKQESECFAAGLLADRIRSRPDIVLGLASGRTMEPLYKLICQQSLNFAAVRSFNLDEYLGLSRDDQRSFRFYMDRHLFDHVNMKQENIGFPSVEGGAEVKTCEYEAEIRKVGGIDLQLLGIGSNGHIGFNEPPSLSTTRTRVQRLSETTRLQNAPMFGGDLNMVPAYAITMGVGTIMEAKEIILLATGKSKARVIAEALEGPITERIPASYLQAHPNCKIILDADAASAMTNAYRQPQTSWKSLKNITSELRIDRN